MLHSLDRAETIELESEETITPPELSNHSSDTIRNNPPLLQHKRTLVVLTSLSLISLLLILFYRNPNSSSLAADQYHNTGINFPQHNKLNSVRDDLVSHPPEKQHIHSIHSFPYPTLGTPTVGSLFNFTKVCLKDIKKYEKTLDTLFKPYNDTNCQHHVYGTTYDQSYVLCQNFVNHSKALINIGLEGSDSFGCSLCSQFKIPNYLYDCRKVAQSNHCENHFSKTFFKKKCFGQKIQKIQDYDYTTLKKEIDDRNLNYKPIIIKMDVEGAEWPVLRYFPTDYLDYIDQFVLEIHLAKDAEADPPHWGNIDIINSLKQKFASVNFHVNNRAQLTVKQMRRQGRFYISSSFEVTLVNRNLLKINRQLRSYHQLVKNYPNDPNLSQLQMYQ